MHRLGWQEEPILGVVDFEDAVIELSKTTYPFRDFDSEGIQHFANQTTLNGIPMKRVPLTNHLLSIEEAIYQDESLSREIRPYLEIEAETYPEDVSIDLLQQAFVYEMFLVTEIERRVGPSMSKNEILEAADQQMNEMNGYVETVDEIIDKKLEHKMSGPEVVDNQQTDPVSQVFQTVTEPVEEEMIQNIPPFEQTL